ncbi:MAG: hypothetical protein QOG98_1238 [Pseudonocardiales bacterium]|nr:hypothetical protein [Pseudonocardiales bacterium]
MINSVSSEQQVGAEEFLALICADDELLRAEFDSIIAAAWGSRSRFRPRPAPPPPPGVAHAVGAQDTGNLAIRPQHPGMDRWARQRSPPLRRAGGVWIRGCGGRSLIMELDVRCAQHAGTSEVRCQLLAGHEREHAAMHRGPSGRTFVLWNSGDEAVSQVGSEFAAGRPWAPGCPRIEDAALIRTRELRGLPSPGTYRPTPPRGKLRSVAHPTFERPA